MTDRYDADSYADQAEKVLANIPVPSAEARATMAVAYALLSVGLRLGEVVDQLRALDDIGAGVTDVKDRLADAEEIAENIAAKLEAK
jgi:hypothetical protein